MVGVLIKICHNILAIDLGVFAPGALKRERHWRLTEHHKNEEGRWIPNELHGPGNLDSWKDAWDFATMVLVMAGAADRGVCEVYRDAFLKLCQTFARSWWILCRAENTRRHEFCLQE